MSDPLKRQIKSPLPLGVIVGGFVWLVLDSVALGLIAALATYVLVKRDQRDEGGSAFDRDEA